MKQERRVLANCGRIDPTKIEQYIAAGGYKAFVKALVRHDARMRSSKKSRPPRSGAGAAPGFTTGLKWGFARKTNSFPKYLICNADEGDPGAFMDRAILEGDPHAVMEGMLIGAYAIGAEYGIYLCPGRIPDCRGAFDHRHCPGRGTGAAGREYPGHRI